MKPTLKLLILEDNHDDILLLKEMIAEIHTYDFIDTTFETVILERLSQGTRYLKSNRVDLILLDLTLPDSQGLNTLQILRKTEEARNIPIIVLTVLDDKEIGIEAVKMGAQEYLVKSDVTARSLVTSIRYAIERQQLKLQLQKETEDLKQSENRFIEIITNIPDGVIIVDADKKVRFMNPAAENLLNLECRKVLGKPLGFPIVADESESKEIEIPGKNRTLLTAEMRGVKIDWKGKQAWLISLRDITGKKKLLRAFQEEKERLDITLRSIADGVIAADEAGVIRIINWMAGQMTGWPQEKAVGKPLAKILKMKNKTTGQIMINPGEKVMKKGETIESFGTDTWVLITRDSSEIPSEYSCAPILKEGKAIGVVLVIRDVTEKKELEEGLRRSQNLEALGVLARGIAHEYSNILTSTLGYISLVKMKTGEKNKAFPRLKKAENAGLRAKEISYRLFTFSKGGEPQKRESSIEETLKQAVHDIFTRKDSPITIEWHIRDLWPMVFDPDQVLLAVRNILKNAAEAIGRPGIDHEGRITIKIENIRIRGIKSTIIKRGNYVKISITDQGPGISEEHLPKIFDPYFSTKEKAEGMGLTTAYSIIRKHGGGIQVKSRKGRGTTVSLLLPASVTLPPQEKPAISIPAVEKEVEPPAPKKKKVLVMDDEDSIREIAKELLEFLEYEIVEAENGEEALELYRSAIERGDPFEAVILDLVTPSGMGGKECVQKLLEIDPNVKAIVSSGYSDDPVITHYQDYGFCGVLPKPYKIHELKEVLSSGPSGVSV
ncbi:MAG: response regulator [Candidatus Aminicenantes bacterium]|nr:MAG: response regulator [Candidatus Aminicenantes bacterium]